MTAASWINSLVRQKKALFPSFGLPRSCEDGWSIFDIIICSWYTNTTRIYNAIKHGLGPARDSLTVYACTSSVHWHSEFLIIDRVVFYTSKMFQKVYYIHLRFGICKNSKNHNFIKLIWRTNPFYWPHSHSFSAASQSARLEQPPPVTEPPPDFAIRRRTKTVI